MTMPQDNRRHWHLDKTINPSHLLTTVTLALTGAWYIMGMQNQIDLGREQNKNTQKQIELVQAQIGEGNGPLRRDIDRIYSELSKVNDRLDGLNEKLSSRSSRSRYLKDYQ